MSKRLVYICDWLPPDFGAVGQYAVLFAREWAGEGWDVTLVGLTSGPTNHSEAEHFGPGTVETIRVCRPTYEKKKLASRLWWTIVSNVLLLRTAFGSIRRAETVLFTGSPPLMLHFIAPLNLLVRKRLIYRITDFHPECLIAERGRTSRLLGLMLRLTHFWRRRVDQFEVLGCDQARRLIDSGISENKIRLKRDPSPVSFAQGLTPLPLPEKLHSAPGIILYSGNWGVAHDDSTFAEGYARYVSESTTPLSLWLNATGAKADRVEQALASQGLPVHRSKLVPLDDVPRLLLAADLHLVTLRDAFVGYVLPSKVHACIQSGKRILFIGDGSSDVHLLASAALPADKYHRVDVGDVAGLTNVLHRIERDIINERKSGMAALESKGDTKKNRSSGKLLFGEKSGEAPC